MGRRRLCRVAADHRRTQSHGLHSPCDRATQRQSLPGRARDRRLMGLDGPLALVGLPRRPDVRGRRSRGRAAVDRHPRRPRPIAGRRRPAGHADVQRRRRDAEWGARWLAPVPRRGRQPRGVRPRRPGHRDPPLPAADPRADGRFRGDPPHRVCAVAVRVRADRAAARGRRGGTRPRLRLRPCRPTGPAGDRAPRQPARRRRPQPRPNQLARRGRCGRLRGLRIGRAHAARPLRTARTSRVGDPF